MSSFADLSAEAWSLRLAYEQLEAQQYGRSWTREEVALGLVGDVGDLMKLVQAAEGVRAIPGHREGIAHELSDCLWSVLVLARLYEVDLESAFRDTMATLKAAVSAKLGLSTPRWMSSCKARRPGLGETSRVRAPPVADRR